MLRAQAIAARVWHNPCGGNVAIQRATPPVNPGEFGVSIAWTYDNDCTVYLATGWHPGWLELCTTMLHEYGHLAGAPHSTNPRSVMYPDLNIVKGDVYRHGHWVHLVEGADHRCYAGIAK